MRRAVGVDIGGTKIAAAIVREDGECTHLKRVPTPDTAPVIVDAVGQLCAELLAVEAEPVSAIGIGSAGQVDVTQGVITYAVNTLPGWVGVPLASTLEHRFGLPIRIDNDVNAMALGEAAFGAGQGTRAALYATVGTGIGGALMLDGNLWRGVHWCAGELGHIVVEHTGERLCSCGVRGHLEAYAAGPAIVRRYAELTRRAAFVDLPEVANRARAGDVIARQAIEESAQVLGTALGGLLNVFDPEALILGGGVPEIGDIWWSAFETALRSNPLPGAQKTALHRAALGTRATLVGAGYLALHPS